jgi:shikimate dehydrogenase
MSRPHCVLAPRAHSRSPWIHARFAELTGQACATAPPSSWTASGAHAAPLRAEGAARLQRHRALQARGRPGRHPASPRRLAGAANTLAGDGGLLADNTDGLGLVADIAQCRRALAARGAADRRGRRRRGVLGPAGAGPARLMWSTAPTQGGAGAGGASRRWPTLRLPPDARRWRPVGDFDVATPPPAAWRGRRAGASVLRPGSLATT